MKLIYTDSTLYVSLNKKMSHNSINSLQKKVFKIMHDYDIKNIVLNTEENYTYHSLDSFIDSYCQSKSSNLKIT